MNQTFNVFQSGKDKSKNVLVKLYSFLDMGEEVGARFDESTKNKLVQAIENTDAEKIKVALVGAFSEGKTSIAAAWLGNANHAGMAFGTKESGAPIKVYDADDQIVLIDTPGLFGNKTKANATTGEIERCRDLTRQYVSEAHLVIYVMNSMHPIKNTHHEELHWLFRTLKLLPRTVFALSRFDEVADITDQRDFDENFAIKKTNLIKLLDRAIMLSDREKNTLSVVAVSPNPFDMGMSHWFANREEFNIISRMEMLKSAINEKIKANGGKTKIDLNMKHSIIKDVLNAKLPQAIHNDLVIDHELEKIQSMYQRLENHCVAVHDDIHHVMVKLTDFVTLYFDDIALQVKNLNTETVQNFHHKVCGKNNGLIEAKIRFTFENQMLTILTQIAQILSNISHEISHYNRDILVLSRGNQNAHLVKEFLIDEHQFSSNQVDLNTGSLGFDLNGVISNQIWSGIESIHRDHNIDALFEQWQPEHAKDAELRALIYKTTECLEQYKSGLMVILEEDNFTQLFSSQLQTLEHTLTALKDTIHAHQMRREKFAHWRAQGEAIEAEFAIFS